MSLKGLQKHQYQHHKFTSEATAARNEFQYGENAAPWTIKDLIIDHKANHRSKLFKGKPHTHSWMEL